MKRVSLVLPLLALLISASSFGQSNSYQALKSKFDDAPDVHSFNVNGFFCRMVLGMAGEWEFKDAIRDVNHVRLITIPTEEFKAQGLSISGFKKLLIKDSFEELASVRDNGDVINFYLQTSGRKNRYMILVQEPNEVVAIELKGDIDVNKLLELEKNKSLSFQN